MPQEKKVKGHFGLSWTSNTELGAICLGCGDIFYIGEIHTILSLNGADWKVHESCLQQIALTIQVFIDSTEDARNSVTERLN